MNSREQILGRIKTNMPEPTALPEVSTFESDFPDVSQTFTDTLAAVYTKVVRVKDLTELLTVVTAMYADMSNKATTIPELLPFADFSISVTDPHELEHVEMAILRAEFGVAENGAVWISDRHLQHRVLPFITQNLAFVIPADALVNNMHDAYQRLTDTTGWGCFIAGPSKTADIEQSLVIGAHGSRSLIVFLVENL